MTRIFGMPDRRVLLLGLDNSGRTAALYMLKEGVVSDNMHCVTPLARHVFFTLRTLRCVVYFYVAGRAVCACSCRVYDFAGQCCSRSKSRAPLVTLSSSHFVNAF